jgi:hypothetical protein
MGLLDYFFDKAIPYIPAGKLPTAGKTFIETLQGERSDITDKNFSLEELAIIQKLIEASKGRGYVNYGDYTKLGMKQKEEGKLPMSISPSLLSLGDSLGNVQTTLGQFQYSIGNDGKVTVSDKYDFNPSDTSTNKEAGIGLFGPYGMIREYAGKRIPPGKGRNVSFTLTPSLGDGLLKTSK